MENSSFGPLCPPDSNGTKTGDMDQATLAVHFPTRHREHTTIHQSYSNTSSDKTSIMRRPRKARTWLRTREVERLRVHSLQLDIQALRSEIRALTIIRTLVEERVQSHDQEDRYDVPILTHATKRSHNPHGIHTPQRCRDSLDGASRTLGISALLNPLP